MHAWVVGGLYIYFTNNSEDVVDNSTTSLFPIQRFENAKELHHTKQTEVFIRLEDLYKNNSRLN